MPKPFPEPQPQRGRSLERGRRGRRGRSARSATRSRTSQMRQTLRKIDEANGWCYKPREQTLDEPVLEEMRKILAPIDENASEAGQARIETREYVRCMEIGKVCIIQLTEEEVQEMVEKDVLHLVAHAVLNAFIIFKKSRTAKKKLLFSKLLMTCGEGLVENGSLDDAGPSQRVPSGHRSTRLVGRHFLERIPPTEKQTKVTRVCKLCADSIKNETGKRGCKEMIYYCPDCEVPFCYYPCFKKFHTKKDYTL
ncbi:PiggyBac transposable element-derived protein 4 [Eumeta japonica]|uniref:PiggyBac transposable element-derived protein 4 n=1 Tax=Eumeta variegata TaxID=151549 RepID=A0A4C1WQW9_EUMVA|nr:PiggyBac transposable element-derived protein 4 [Eumeta japonica]